MIVGTDPSAVIAWLGTATRPARLAAFYIAELGQARVLLQSIPLNEARMLTPLTIPCAKPSWTARTPLTSRTRPQNALDTHEKWPDCCGRIDVRVTRGLLEKI
jgi:hypothetical protein